MAGQLRRLCSRQRDRISDVSGSCEKIMSAIFRAAGSTAGCGCLAVRPRIIRQMEESLWTDAPVSASVIFSHQSDAAGDTAPVPYGYCSRNGAGCIFRHDRSYPAQGASLEKAASLGSSDRHGSCLFLADPRGFRLDPAVYRCHDSMECRLCDTGTA